MRPSPFSRYIFPIPSGGGVVNLAFTKNKNHLRFYNNLYFSFLSNFKKSRIMLPILPNFLVGYTKVVFVFESIFFETVKSTNYEIESLLKVSALVFFPIYSSSTVSSPAHSLITNYIYCTQAVAPRPVIANIISKF